jgi:hypothetical protein
VIVSCPARGFLEARIEFDEARLTAIYPTLDVETVRAHLVIIPVICRGGEQAGPIGQLSQRERFHWLMAPRSTIIQTSPVHTGCCQDRLPCLSTCLTRWYDCRARHPLRRSPAWQEHVSVGNR